MYLRPAKLQDALVALGETTATVLSGGTDLFPALTVPSLSGRVIDISAISEMKGIRQTADHVVFGGRTTWTEVLKAPLPRGFDGLKAAAREIGGVQIQNQATMAGNVCNASPAADGVAALIALDAELTLASQNGSRIMPLSQFVVGNRKTGKRPDELLTSIRIPRRLETAASTFLKLGARRYLVISIVMVAANLLFDRDGTIREALICVGSCSPVAARLAELERALVGRSIRDGLQSIVKDQHLAELAPIDDLRATAAYRKEAAGTLVQRALIACAEKAI